MSEDNPKKRKVAAPTSAAAFGSQEKEATAAMEATFSKLIQEALLVITKTVVEDLKATPAPPAAALAAAAAAATPVGPSVVSELTNSTADYHRKPSITKPLGLGLDPKIKRKIWADEYVDFTLLFNIGGQEKDHLTLSDDGTVHLVKQSSGKEIKTVFQWMIAFNMFGAIYSKKIKIRESLSFNMLVGLWIFR